MGSRQPTSANNGTEILFPTAAAASNGLPLVADADGVTRITALGGTAHEVVAIPVGFNWDDANFPLVIGLRNNISSTGGGVLLDGSFDIEDNAIYQQCRNGPQIYVDTATGNNTTGTGAIGAKYKSISRATTAGNLAGVPYTRLTTAGLYSKDENFCSTASSGTASSTVPVVDIAVGGRVISTTSDSYSWSVNGTYGHVFGTTTTVANVTRVMDMGRPDRQLFGLYDDFESVASIALCAGTPNSFYFESGVPKVWVNRADGQAPSNTNTRVYRSQSNLIVSSTNKISHFMIGNDAASGFDLEGSLSNNSVVSMSFSGTAPLTQQIFYARNCTFRYGGAFGTSGGNGVAINSLTGLTFLENCDVSGNVNDGINIHNSNALGPCYLLTLNCTALRNGRRGATSCNAWTLHEDCIGIDIASRFKNAAGCTVHVIQTSQGLLIGTAAEFSLGDLHLGGTFRPTEYRTDNTATLTLIKARADCSAGGIAYNAGGGLITRSECWPTNGSTI